MSSGSRTEMLRRAKLMADKKKNEKSVDNTVPSKPVSEPTTPVVDAESKPKPVEPARVEPTVTEQPIQDMASEPSINVVEAEPLQKATQETSKAKREDTDTFESDTGMREQTRQNEAFDEASSNESTHMNPYGNNIPHAVKGMDVSFGDMFIMDRKHGVVYDDAYRRSVIKNVPTVVIDASVADLRKRYVGQTVRIGHITYTIEASNKVFVTNASTIRFLLLDSLSDAGLKVQIARQMFLSRYPLGEQVLFKPSQVTSDELDILCLLVASASTTEDTSVKTLQNLNRMVNEINDRTKVTQSSILTMSDHFSKLLYGITHGMSWLVGEKMGRLTRRLPSHDEEIPSALQEPVVEKLTAAFYSIFGTSYLNRQKTKDRDGRMRGRRN